MMPAVAMVSSLPVDFVIAGDLFNAQGLQILQFVLVFLQRMPGDKEAEDFLFRREPRVLIPVRHVGQLSCVSALLLFLEDPKQPMLSGLGIALCFLRAAPWPYRVRP